MAIEVINVSAPDDGLGDKLRNSWIKGNSNFSYLDINKVGYNTTVLSDYTNQLQITNQSDAPGMYITNDSTGPGISIYSSFNGSKSLDIYNYGGTNITLRHSLTNSSLVIDYKKDVNTKFSLNTNGDVTANKLIKQGGTSSQFLLANGDVTTLATAYSAYTAVIRRIANQQIEVLSVLNNNLGATITWTTGGTGSPGWFYCTASSSIFKNQKTFHFMSCYQASGNRELFKGMYYTPTQYDFHVEDMNSGSEMNNFQPTLVEIRIYP